MTSELPDWRTNGAGTRVRVALWLASEVGIGGVFTKAQLRLAFPEVEQVDRRMRDLRRYGWEIDSSDATLELGELRLVAIGQPVWDADVAPAERESRLSNKQRREILAADNYMCVFCGVAAGDRYADRPGQTARLLVVKTGTSKQEAVFHTCCEACKPTAIEMRDDPDFLQAVHSLRQGEVVKLARWIDQGFRDRSRAEKMWARYLKLPPGARDESANFIRASAEQVEWPER